MPPMTGGFDASTVAPKQISGSVHPIGKYPFRIRAAEIVETKDKTGGMYVVTFQTQAGDIVFRFNIWNKSDDARRIANDQLSMLCHCTGIFRLNWQDEGRAMIGGEGVIEVGFQKGEEPSHDKPEGGYTEIKKFLDRNGNEPGKAPAAAPQPAPASSPAPMQGQPQAGGWNPTPANPAPAPQSQPMTQQTDGGWGTGAQTNLPPAQPPQPGWNPNPGLQQATLPSAPAPGAAPPWANR